ncbi:uncharacterized protein J8A68_003557 [[Candida] subhashii]|uniref:Uncharacterized protein n=1 Tax=[Candida] subhashii TaxID=561895 RepID=A0A8J5QDJ5_9ASCO|nr:uncharacterized protein J8A68_003557 [[Candida] subhashii]KAG7662931.1 hypothetical protein J8A68_003557 [[Candida] subhashii]
MNWAYGDSGIQVLIAKICWLYLFHPLLNITHLIQNLENLHSNIQSGKVDYLEMHMLMNSTNGYSDVTKYEEFLSVLKSVTTEYFSIMKEKECLNNGSNYIIKLYGLGESELSIMIVKRLLKQNGYGLQGGKFTSENVREKDLLKYLLSFNDIPQELSLEDSIKYILILLDHGTSRKLTYVLAKKIEKAIGVINSCNLNEVYRVFNTLNGKVSISMALNYLNYIISYNIMFHTFDKLPSCIEKQFSTSFALPPLSKLYEEAQIEKDPLGKLFDLVNETKVSVVLFQTQFKLLKVFQKFMNQDSKTIEYVNQFSDNKLVQNKLNEKIVLQFMELYISGLISSLLVATKFPISISTYSIQRINESFYQLFNLNFKSININLIWICLINIVNDICYADLRFIQTFIQMFEYQLKKDDSVFKDELIKSGLDFFINTFKPEHKWFANTQTAQDSATEEIKLDDFKFLYSFQISPGTQDYSFDSSTPVKFMNNVRQHSTHVDQFK